MLCVTSSLNYFGFLFEHTSDVDSFHSLRHEIIGVSKIINKIELVHTPAV